MAHRFRTFSNSHHNTMMRRSEQGRRPQATKPGWATWRHAGGCSCPLCSRAREAAAQAQLQGRSPSTPTNQRGSAPSSARPQETRRRERSPPPPAPRKQHQEPQRQRQEQQEIHSRNYPRPCAPATAPGTSNSIVFVEPYSPCSDGDNNSEIDNVERLLSTRWQNFETTSEDANFSICRVFTARFAVLHDTMLFRLHIKGKLASTDMSITLTLPRHAHVAANGNDHQFSVALISSPDSLMFAPVTITPGSNLLTINQQSLRSDTVYEIWVQSFVEIRRDC